MRITPVRVLIAVVLLFGLIQLIPLAEKTVKNYVSNMLAKLGMQRRTEVAAYAARLDERRKRRPQL